MLAVIIFFSLRATFETSVVVYGSMEPGIEDGQRLIINKATYHFHEPERGDVIILYPPHDPDDTYIKRIIALPGDTIEVKRGRVYINGSPVHEPYLKEPPTYTLQQQTIPENNYFVLGDNRNVSNDSHNGWTLPRESIIGKVWLSIWPPDKWEVVDNYPLGEQLAKVDE